MLTILLVVHMTVNNPIPPPATPTRPSPFFARSHNTNRVPAGQGPPPAVAPLAQPNLVLQSAQQNLQNKGYPVSPNGVLDFRTQGAIQHFQGTQGLQRTGVLDEPTLRALGLAQP
jgi:hypothetical protein